MEPRERDSVKPLELFFDLVVRELLDIEALHSGGPGTPTSWMNAS
jgi:hypothetical protein